MRHSIITLLTFATLAWQPVHGQGGSPPPDIRIVENDGTFGALPGIWGGLPAPGTTNFPVNDLFLIGSEPMAKLPPERRSGFAWQEQNGVAVSRVMGFILAFVNAGESPWDLGNAWSAPENYIMTPGQWARPQVRDMFSIELHDGPNLIHQWFISATFYPDALPALPGMARGPFGAWHAGLSPGWATMPTDPLITGAWVDTSGVQDGVYTLVIRLRNVAATARLVLIESLELRVVSLAAVPPAPQANKSGTTNPPVIPPPPPPLPPAN